MPSHPRRWKRSRPPFASSPPARSRLPNGHTIGLRRDSIGLWDLRGLLFHPATDVGVQRAALVELVGRARRHRGAWMIGLVGVLLPGLREHGVPADGRSGGTASSGGMVLVSLLEGLDDPDMSKEAAAESLLRTVGSTPAARARPARRRRFCSRPRRAPMSRYLTVEEVAEALGVSASWVYKHKDMLGGVRLGKRLWRFPERGPHDADATSQRIAAAGQGGCRRRSTRQLGPSQLAPRLASRGSPTPYSEGAAAQCSGWYRQLPEPSPLDHPSISI